jgi:hypothetical protein
VAVNWQQHRGVLASGEGENGRSIFFAPLGSGPALTALQFRTYRTLSGKTRPYSAIVTDFALLLINAVSISDSLGRKVGVAEIEAYGVIHPSDETFYGQMDFLCCTLSRYEALLRALRRF